MSSLLLPIGGAIIGGIFGGSFGAALGWTVGSIIGNQVFGQEAPDRVIEGPRLKDIQIQGSAYGAPIPRVYGSARLAGNIIWSAGIQEHRHVTTIETSSGGKGGGQTQTTTQITYTYTCSFAVGICEGPITALRRIWADGKLIFDRSDNVNSLDDYFQSVIVEGINATIYKGSETQQPDSLIEAHEGSDNVPGYRGLAYIVFEDLPLENYGNRIPNLEFEICAAESTQAAISPGYDNFQRIDGHKDGIFYDFYAPDYIDSSVPAQWIYCYMADGLTGNDSQLFKLALPEDASLYGSNFTKGSKPWLHGNWACSGYYGLLSSIYHYFVCFWDLATGKEIEMIEVSDWIVQAAGLTNNNKYRVVGGTYIGQVGAPDFGCSISENEMAFLFPRTAYSGYEDEFASGYQIIRFKPPVFANVGTGYVPLEPVKLLEIGPVIEIPTGYNLADVKYYNGYFYLLWNNTSNTTKILAKYDPDTGEQLDSADPTASYWSDSFAIVNGNVVIDRRPFYGTANPRYLCILDGIITSSYLQWPQNPTEAIDLAAEVISPILEACGLSSSDYDLSELAGLELYGYVRDRVMTARAALEPLMTAYQFDFAEIDYRLVAKLRSSSSIRSINENELILDSNKTCLQINIQQEQDLPRVLEIRYYDVDNAHQINVQRSIYPITTSNDTKIVDMPISITSTNALRVAEILHMVAFGERKTARFSLCAKHLDLTPGDVVTIGEYMVRIQTQKVFQPSLIELTGSVMPTTALYDSSSEAESTYFQDQSIGPVGPTLYVFLDLPPLRDIDVTPGLYIAAYGLRPNWRGAWVYKSDDEGQTGTRVVLISDSSIVGTCETQLSPGPSTVWDNENTVKIRLLTPDATLSSVSEASAMAGSNTAAIGSDSSGWEIISFTTAIENTDGTYTLSGLLRGRLGTEHMIDSHAEGDQFVLLDSSKLIRLSLTEDDVATTKYLKVVSIGRFASDYDWIGYYYSGIGLKPLSPVHITAYREADNDIVIQWKRRTRAGGEWNDYSDVPLHEESEEYEVDILSGSTVKRTISTTEESATYTASQQNTDFGGLVTSLHVKIYQKSALVGRGWPGEATLSVPTLEENNEH